MTIIECFENAPFENTISALTANPKKIIYVGADPKMEEKVAKHKAFLYSKHISPIIEIRRIDKNNLQNIVDELSAIIQQENGCVIDVSGGEDLVLMAVGMVYQQHRHTYPIQIQRVDVASGRIIDCDGDNITTFSDKITLTVDELIALHGGVVVPENPQPGPTTDANDIDLLWDICRIDSGKWNKFISYLNEFRSRGDNGSTELTVQMNVTDLSGSLKDFDHKYTVVQNYLIQLENDGLIYDFHTSYNRLNFTYKNDMVSRAMSRSGNVFEMKVYYEA